MPLGYYMRYIVVDERPVTLTDVQTALSEPDGDYVVDGEETEASVSFRGQVVGHLTLNVPGDGLFDEERDELVEFADEGDARGKRRVLDALRRARGIVAVQVLFGDGDPERTLGALDPLWRWLHVNRRGLLQADGEGYYDGQELIFELE